MLTAILLSVGAFVPATRAQVAAEDEHLIERPEVVVRLGALDKEGRPVEGLKPEDLRVTVEGAPQNLLFFKQGAEGPLHVVVMLDASASQERVLLWAQEGADRLVPALLTGGSNDAAVVSFTGEVKVVRALTSDAAAVRRAIASVEFVPPSGYIPGGIIIGGRPPDPNNDPNMRAGSTALWDALVGVCDEVFARAAPGGRAVVLVTDGVDTNSRTKSDKAVERLLSEGVAVYSVGIGDEYSFDGVDKSALRKLSERTGGRAVFPKKINEVPVAFEQVRRDLLNFYTLKFNVPALWLAGKPLKLRVELINPELRRQGVQLSYPQTLFKRPSARK
ncbi:MAG TPA: VWA domain-containing protein [Pyrinomonadaceae bacterium]